MKITSDLAKSTSNFLKHGLRLEPAVDFDFGAAIYFPADVHLYGETRVKARGMLNGKVHALIFTERDNGIRAISFRRANKSEKRRYEGEKTSPPS